MDEADIELPHFSKDQIFSNKFWEPTRRNWSLCRTKILGCAELTRRRIPLLRQVFSDEWNRRIAVRVRFPGSRRMAGASRAACELSHVSAILRCGCWGEIEGRWGNTTDESTVVCPGDRFTPSPGPETRAAMRSVPEDRWCCRFGQETTLRG